MYEKHLLQDSNPLQRAFVADMYPIKPNSAAMHLAEVKSDWCVSAEAQLVSACERLRGPALGHDSSWSACPPLKYLIILTDMSVLPARPTNCPYVSYPPHKLSTGRSSALHMGVHEIERVVIRQNSIKRLRCADKQMQCGHDKLRRC